MRKGWEYKKLGEVLETTSGGTPSKSHKEYYEGGTIPWLRSGEVSKGDIYDAELYITEKGLKKSSAKLFPIDTVLIAMYGATVGQVGILKSTLCTNQAICGILPNKDFHPNFLKYVLLANKKNYLKQAMGGAQPNISQQVIKSTYIPIVKFSEQESVVSELDKINELIRLKKEQLKDFDNLAQSLFYEMFGDPVENEKGWEVKKLGDVCTFSQGMQVPIENQKEIQNEGDVRFLRIIDFTQGKDAPRYVECDNDKYILHEKEIAIVRYGTPGFICTGKIGAIANNLFKLNPVSDNIFVFEYLVHWLSTDAFQLSIKGKQYGAALQAIKFSTIQNIEIILPPLPLQRLFAQRIEQIEREKSEVQKSIQDLETLLASRMQYWFE